MRVAVHEGADGARETVVEAGAGAASLGDVAIETLIAEGQAGLERLRAAAETASGGEDGDRGRVLAPLRRPGKQIFVGVNYEDHVAELPPPWKMTEEPFFFSKLQTAIIGPGDAIVLPADDSSVDYEVEMVAVIGKTASKVKADDALDHIFGWTIVNDVTERAIQATDNQLTMAKGVDTFCPLGPAIVLRDELPDPGSLDIWTEVNGETRQSSNTSKLIFSVEEIIESVSRLITLEPGDTVSTGTPAGVGAFATPPRFLQPGDVVTVGVEGIGELSNPVVAGW
jgi:2-keto-4-pentenoate hydratase/2-oxohepta-3-ene-1,7-dioic acid hydratase in catechol pathway